MTENPLHDAAVETVMAIDKLARVVHGMGARDTARKITGTLDFMMSDILDNEMYLDVYVEAARNVYTAEERAAFVVSLSRDLKFSRVEPTAETRGIVAEYLQRLKEG